MIEWKLQEEGFDPDKIASNGNKFLIGNGYMGIRGTLEEYGREQFAAVNLAGIYDRVGDGWREPLNAPNGLYTLLQADGATYALPDVRPEEHKVCLDYRKGLFSRKTTWMTANGRKLTLETERFASLAEPHLIAMSCRVTADHKANITLMTGIDGEVWDINGPHYDEIIFSEARGCIKAVAVTHEKGDRVCVAECCSTGFENDETIVTGKRGIMRHIRFAAEPGKTYEVTKWISVYTGRDLHDFESKALLRANDNMKSGYAASKAAHISEWEEKWAVSEVEIEGDDAAMEALNYSLYHLHSIAPRHSQSLSIAARGLSGQTYKGAVFWDTEMFMLDFFLFTEPSVARALVKYRIDTLRGAREKAAGYGHKGAFYAWESQEGGFDACTDYNVVDVFTGRPMRTYFKDKQVHISAAVVHGIMRYVDITGDSSVLDEGGAETIIECAEFYYSLLLRKAGGDNYELHDVIGPDEYHERVNNNGYTNRMAKYTLDMAVKVLDMATRVPDMAVKVLDLAYGLLPDTKDRLSGKYSVRKLRQKYKDASGHLYIPEPGEGGVIEQFDGYMKLEDVTIETLKGRLLHEKEYWGGAYGVAAHTKVIKQADVVTWLTLFPGDFQEDVLRKNWDYYEPRTEHGSSLSACMYALLACRFGRPELAYPFFLKSARADISGGGKQWAGLIYIGGTHPAASGGAYMTAVRGFGGVSFEEGGIKAQPCLPEGWKRLKFKLRYRGRLYEIDETAEGAVIEECGE